MNSIPHHLVNRYLNLASIEQAATKNLIPSKIVPSCHLKMFLVFQNIEGSERLQEGAPMPPSSPATAGLKLQRQDFKLLLSTGHTFVTTH